MGRIPVGGDLKSAVSPQEEYYRGRKNAWGITTEPHEPGGRGKHMSTDKRTRKAVASCTLRCEGVSTVEVAPLLEKGRAGVSITVYEDGHRELGCAYLNQEDHECMAGAEGETRRCIHLYPVRARAFNMC